MARVARSPASVSSGPRFTSTSFARRRCARTSRAAGPRALAWRLRLEGRHFFHAVKYKGLVQVRFPCGFLFDDMGTTPIKHPFPWNCIREAH